MLGEPPAMFVEELPERLLRGGVFRQNTSARDLRDVRGLEVNLQREAVHQPCKFDLLVVETADELAKLLLGGDDEPVLAAAFHPKALHDGLKVEHLLDVASDELAHLVDDEHQRLARADGASSAHWRARRTCPARCPPCFLRPSPKNPPLDKFRDEVREALEAPAHSISNTVP